MNHLYAYGSFSHPDESGSPDRIDLIVVGRSHPLAQKDETDGQQKGHPEMM
jgi:hypothetical protein